MTPEPIEALVERVRDGLPPRGMTSIPEVPYKPAQANAYHAALTELAERLKAAERERDEARNLSVQLGNSGVKARAQRDEALVLAQQVPQLVEALEDILAYDKGIHELTDPRDIARAALAKVLPLI